ncbi:MAG: hypothetical protein AAF074_17525 [Pseudomonadota bacterium]
MALDLRVFEKVVAVELTDDGWPSLKFLVGITQADLIWLQAIGGGPDPRKLILDAVHLVHRCSNLAGLVDRSGLTARLPRGHRSLPPSWPQPWHGRLLLASLILGQAIVFMAMEDEPRADLDQ